MDPNTFPTKGNLILAKNALALSKQGFDLMDKKRNILIRELMELISEASDIQNQIDETFSNAYQALQKANIQMGIHQVEQIAKAVPVENSIRIKRRSVMGTEIPKVEYEKKKQAPAYSFYHTRMHTALPIISKRRRNARMHSRTLQFRSMKNCRVRYRIIWRKKRGKSSQDRKL